MDDDDDDDDDDEDDLKNSDIYNCLLIVTRNGTDPTYRNIFYIWHR